MPKILKKILTGTFMKNQFSAVYIIWHYLPQEQMHNGTKRKKKKKKPSADINLLSSPHFFISKPQKKKAKQRFKSGKGQVFIIVVYL